MTWHRFWTAACSGFFPTCARLKGAGLVESSQLGCTRRQRQRWYLTDTCLEQAGMTGCTWHDDPARRRLLELLPSVEQLYRVMGSVTTMGPFREFQWLDGLGTRGPSCDAAVRYERGWLALFWCGSLLSETRLGDRLTQFPLDCQSLAVGAPQPWPSLIHLVAADEWQRELASRVLGDFGMERQAVIWCVADGSSTGSKDAGAGRGWVYQPVKGRSASSSSWESLLSGSLWSGVGGLVSARVLDAVIQWPGAHLRFLKAVLHEGRSENRVRMSCARLVSAGLIMQDGQGQSGRYFATDKGLNLRVRQDRIHHLQAKSRTGLSQWQEASPTKLKRTASKAHEDGLRAVLGPFAAKGCPVANGTRYGEHLGSDGGIDPDAMLYLTNSPHGEGWAYVEYERSARRRSRVSGKLRGYGSTRRRDNYPVILICWDDEAERVFQEEGRRLGIQLLTTTLRRLKDHSPVETSQCWSMYGQLVQLG